MTLSINRVVEIGPGGAGREARAVDRRFVCENEIDRALIPGEIERRSLGEEEQGDNPFVRRFVVTVDAIAGVRDEHAVHVDDRIAGALYAEALDLRDFPVRRD